MPLVRRIPKRGFHNKFALEVAIVNVGDLELRFNAGEEVSPATLKTRGLVKGQYDLLKVLADGELTKSLKISAHQFSAAAKEKIEKAGGQITRVAGQEAGSEGKRSEVRKKAGSRKHVDPNGGIRADPKREQERSRFRHSDSVFDLFGFRSAPISVHIARRLERLGTNPCGKRFASSLRSRSCA